MLKDADVTAFPSKTGCFQENGNLNINSWYYALLAVFCFIVLKCGKRLLKIETQQE